MGFAAIGTKSPRQIEKYVRTQARTSAFVVLTAHARQRMKERNVLYSEVLECLRCGHVVLAPEPNAAKASLEVRMEYYVAGRTLKTVVALCDEDPHVVVVTVIALI